MKREDNNNELQEAAETTEATGSTDTTETTEVTGTADTTETTEVTGTMDTGGKTKKPVYKKWWFWLIIVIILFIIIGSTGGDDGENTESADAAAESQEDTAEDTDSSAENEEDSAESEDAGTESHIYDDAEIIDVMNGVGTDVIGQYSLIKADSSEITLETLEDWYFNYITTNDYNWYVILYTDKSDNSGVYGITGIIEHDVIFEEDEYGVYSVSDSSTATVYYYPIDGSLEMHYYEDEEDEEETDTSAENDSAEDASAENASAEDASAEDDAAESSSGIVAILEQLGTFDETTVEGSGDDVVDLPVTGIPILMDITYSGDSNFVVYTVDADGENVDLLVNTIGSYAGTQTDYLDFSDVAMLSIQSSGDWSITFKPLSSMPELINGGENSGDGVYYISTESLTKLTFTNSGEGNFIVRGIGMDDSDLLINEIGDYEGTVIWAQEESFLIVTSDGTWTASW